MNPQAERIRVSAVAALLAAALYYIGDWRVIFAVLLPIAAHELAHVAALILLGFRVNGVRVELRGLCIEYGGFAGRRTEALAAAAGPAAGLIYWATASALSRSSGSSWLSLTAGASLLLSLFNLIPALPLDGGRILLCLMSAAPGDRASRICERLSLFIGVVLFALSLWFALHGMGLGPTAAALWLLLYQVREPALVNIRELL